MNHATITADGVGHFELKTLSGHTLFADVAEVPDETPDQLIFCSIGGNMQVNGTLEFFEIRENVTEMVLTLDYYIESPLHRVMDRVTSGMDRFLNRLLMRIQMHFDGIHAFPEVKADELGLLRTPYLVEAAD